MGITIRMATGDEHEALVPILLLAEEWERGLRWSLEHMADAVYRMDNNGTPVGAATVQWREEHWEILELAIIPGLQGQGLGRHFIDWLADEARRNNKRRLLVGTANSSIGNIVFYQRCKMRMDSVRRDYFRYYREPVIENGLPKRDMIVFSLEL